jgi:hypothetical protein
MSTDPQPVTLPHLGDKQLNFLLYGPLHPGDDSFEDEVAARQAWEKNRASILACYQSGRRPWAWRTYDFPQVPWKGYANECSVLWRAGVLSAEEKALLERRWRQEFEKALQPDFFFCAGQGKFLDGAAARAAHHRAVDIPSELVKRWTTAERQRSQKKEAPRGDAAGP